MSEKIIISTIGSSGVEVGTLPTLFNIVEISSVFVIPTGSSGAPSFLDSLVSYWKMDEQIGTRYDSYGLNNFNSSGSVGVFNGIINTAASCSISNYLIQPNNASLQIGSGDSFTIAGWFFRGTDTAYAPLFSKRFDGSGGGDDYCIDILDVAHPSSSKFRFYTGTTSGTFPSVYSTTYGSYTNGNWVFLCCWWDSGSKTLNMQVNNGGVDSVPYDRGFINTTASLAIGRYRNADTLYQLMGAVDELGFWKRALTDSERSQLYNGGIGLSYPFITSSVITRNLVSYWKLDESSGTRYDTIGPNHLSNINTVTSQCGKVKIASEFTSSNSQFLGLSGSQTLKGGNYDFTWTAWVLIYSKPSNIMGIVNKGTFSGAATNNDYGIYWDNGTDKFGFSIMNGVNNLDLYATSFGSPSIGKWCFVCAWHDSNADQVYIQINNGTINSSSWSSGSWSSNNEFKIGNTFGSNRYWNGLIEGVGFWKRVLTDSERTYLYNSGSGLTYPFNPPNIFNNLISYWKMDEEFGTRYDSYGGNNLGVTNNTSITGSQISIIGQSLDRNTTGQMAYINNNSFIQIEKSEGFTWAFWALRRTTNGSFDPIISRAITGTGYGDEFAIDVIGTQFYRFYVGTGVSYKEVFSGNYGTVQNNVWTFLCCWFDPTLQTLNMQINGGPIDSVAFTGSVGQTNSALWFGRYESATSLNWDGQLDEIGFWKRVLTSDERAFLYNSGSGRTYPFNENPLFNKMVSYWTLDEVTGSRYDSFGSNKLTQVNGTVTSGLAKSNLGAQFTASNFRGLSVAHNGSLSLTGSSFTFTGWFNCSVLPSTGEGKTIISKYPLISGQREYTVLYENNSGPVKFHLVVSNNGTDVIAVTSSVIPGANSWNFFVAYYDFTNKVIGIELNLTSSTSAPYTASINGGTGSFYLGSLNNSVGAYNFDGTIDEVGLWRRLLTTQEKSILYNSGSGKSFPFTQSLTTTTSSLPSNILAWWSADYLGLPHSTSFAAWMDNSGRRLLYTSSNLSNLSYTSSTKGATYMDNQLNGKPSVYFTGSLFGGMDVFVSQSITESAEIFILFKNLSDPATKQDETGLYSFGGNDTNGVIPYTDGIFYDNFCSLTRKSFNPINRPLTTDWTLYNVHSAINDWSASINGLGLYSTTTNDPRFTGSCFLAGGRQNTSQTWYLKGWISEILLYGKTLSESERYSVHEYFSNKYKKALKDIPTVTLEAITSRATGSLRNNFTGDVGFIFSVPFSSSVTHLGRWRVEGNDQKHTVRLFETSSGCDLASVVIDSSTMTGSGYQYLQLSRSVMLSSGSKYCLITRETFSDDFWYDEDQLISSSVPIIADWAFAQGNPSGGSNLNGIKQYGGANFKYVTTSDSSSKDIDFIKSRDGGTLRNDFKGDVGYAFFVDRTTLITALSIYKYYLNSGIHGVRIYDSSSLSNLTTCSINLLNPMPNYKFEHNYLSQSVGLVSGTMYLMMVSQSIGGDSWYDFDLTYTTSSKSIFVTGSVYWTASIGYVFPTGIGKMYAAPNFKYIQNSMLNGLYGYWKLDEVGGQRRSSIGSATLSDNNTVPSGVGILGYCATFTSSNLEYLTVPDSAQISTGDIDFTITAWINIASKGSQKIILNKWTTGPGFEYILYYDNSVDRIRFAVNGSGGIVIFTADNFGSPPTNTWFFGCFWHDSVGNTVNLQINNGTIDSTAHTAGVIDGASDLTIGRHNDGGGTQYWDGSISDVGFWKRVLTNSERSKLYNSGSGWAFPFISAS